MLFQDNFKLNNVSKNIKQTIYLVIKHFYILITIDFHSHSNIHAWNFKNSTFKPFI